MRKTNQGNGARPRLLVLVDESNVGSSVRSVGRGLDWLKLRDFLAGPNTGFVNQTVSYVLPRTYGVELQFRY